MTDTAKPTSFSLELSAELQKEIAEYANLIPLEPISAELIDVYTKTGLTPRQLLEQRDELLNAVEGFIKSFHHSVITDDLEQFPAMAAGIAAMNKARGIPEGCTRTFICEHPNWPNGIWEIDPVSALAKCGKVGVK